MTIHHPSPGLLGQREVLALAITAVFFGSMLVLAALDLPVEDILILLCGTAGAAIAAVITLAMASAARSNREAHHQAVAALARLANQV